MTQDNASIGLKGAAYVPNDVYVGTNVVRRHVAEFFYTAAHQGLLAEGEQVLAVFDCVILEPSGARLGGLTLHDYAVLTDRHLITWGRGNSRDIVDKFPWADVNVAKYGSRSPIEGVVKFIYGQRPVSNQKRKINLSNRPEGVPVVPTETVVNGGLTGGVTLYLDLIPIDEVRTLAFMMEYLVGDGETVPSADDFRSHFNAQIQESAARLSHINSLIAPFYVEQANGVLIEADAVEEDNLRRAAGRKRNPPSPYENPETPYRGGGGGSGMVRVREERTVRVPTPRPAAPPPAARPRDAEPSSGGLNRGNRQVSTGAPGSNEPRTIGLRETVSLNTSPLNLPSKLDAYEGRVSGARPAASATPAPRPERAVVPSRPTPPPRPAPTAAPRPEPTTRVTPEPSVRASGMVMDDIQTGNLPSDRPLVVPVGVVLGREALNVYSLSRLARGLWIDPRNLGRNVSDLGDTASVLVEITNLLSDDVLVRRTALFRLRDALNSGVIARNPIFHYTIWPFIKPVLDAIRLPGERRRSVVPNRVRVRANGNGKHNGNGKNGGPKPPTSTTAPGMVKVDVPPAPASPPPKPNGGSIKVNITGEAPARPIAPDNEPPTRVPATPPPAPVSPAPPTPPKAGVTEVPADFLGKEKPESPAAVNAATSSKPADAARETIQPGEQNAQPMANESADKAKAEAIATDDGPPAMPSADLLQPEGDDAPLNTSGSSTDTLANLDRPDDQPTPKSKLEGM